VFGPVLHVCVYERADLDRVLAWLRDTGFGLTLGIHSRLQGFVDRVVAEARVGKRLRESQHDRRRGRRAALRRRRPLGHRPEGRRAALHAQVSRPSGTLTVNTAAIGGVTELLSRR
jgi:RHH-type proline utilization regulon transcriptional repressor/proline dehydrogenase/delta 1-pyrroline-5-carboxylate dehydrogenase